MSRILQNELATIPVLFFIYLTAHHARNGKNDPDKIYEPLEANRNGKKLDEPENWPVH